MTHIETQVVCYRDDSDWRNEAEAVKKHFRCIGNRTAIKSGELVIPRFSALPFNKEFCDDVEYVGAKMINNYRQHQYIADLGNWYPDLMELTPRTWRNLHEIPDDGTQFVLKGATNSRKELWKTHMWAANKTEAIQVHSRLQNDGLIMYQDIYIREYIELEKLYEGLQGLPITREYRFFIYKNKVLSSGFYWSNYYEDLLDMGFVLDPNEVPKEFLDKVISKIQNTSVSEAPNFYVIDVAKTSSGNWIVIELNDGNMSGLSMNNPDVLFGNLKAELIAEQKQ